MNTTTLLAKIKESHPASEIIFDDGEYVVIDIDPKSELPPICANADAQFEKVAEEFGIVYDGFDCKQIAFYPK